MKFNDIRVAILRIEGTNCEDEAFYAFKMLGADPDYVHLNEIKHKKKNLDNYQMLYLPGGFSGGDYVRAGAIFAARIKGLMQKDLLNFMEEGKPILGVCNGFQILLELGILPGLEEKMSEKPMAVLSTNESNRFECRWIHVKKESEKCIYLKKYRIDMLSLPIAHAEGKLILQENSILEKLIDNDQIAFRYVDDQGNYAGYPWNPNGSIYNIGGLCDQSGTIMGMMPHPERSFSKYQHPEWTRGEAKEFGKPIFESVLDYISKKF